MFKAIEDNLINGNIKDMKKGLKKLSLNQRYDFLQHIKKNSKYDYILKIIVTKDF